jgi:hypothetical protein
MLSLTRTGRLIDQRRPAEQGDPGLPSIASPVRLGGLSTLPILRLKREKRHET